ncbi:hypothetical protein KC315_g1247 [Hortaea werneckii]|nr:hypothetical protein KC315_g1247 [Hortaea werneckii]KAI7492195.1 hypothetical protein KC357_g1365 [Hortaea werneckii]
MSQYDTIGARYASMEDLPARAVEKLSILNILGDVRGLRCLDLACGLGRWSEFLVKQGAAHVTGVDLSEGMITSAKAGLDKMPDEERRKIAYHAGDCGKPMAVPNGPFDLAFSVYFFNYAGTYEEMLGMWTNIYLNLKPGGRMVALTVNTFVGWDVPFDEQYGISAVATAKTDEGGWKCHISAHTQPEKIEFDVFHYNHKFYERAAEEAGMRELTWRSHVLPKGDGRPEGYWDVFNLRPHCALLTATRPA